MPYSACPSLRHASPRLLRKAAVSSANGTPHSLLQTKNNYSDLNERSADRPIYLKGLSGTRVPHKTHGPFRSDGIFLFFGDRSQGALSVHWKFSYCHLFALSWEYDSLDFNLRSLETQITSLLLCGMFHTNHNHYHLQVYSFIQLAAWHGFFR